MNKSWEREERFTSGRDQDAWEDGTASSDIGPAVLGSYFFSLGEAGQRVPTSLERGLCKWSDDEKIFDKTSQLCLEHYIQHRQLMAEREWYPLY